jgi:uncharacterized protein
MRCPLCKREVEWEGNAYRPFCSERCKLIDLDNWLSGRYRIAAAPKVEPENTGGRDSADTEGEGE